jgi:Tfp pilus assembly protein FimV
MLEHKCQNHKASLGSPDSEGGRIASCPQCGTKVHKAKSRVRFAKTYLSSGLKEKAASILKEVMEKYPNTDSAAEAKKLLRDAEEE